MNNEIFTIRVLLADKSYPIKVRRDEEEIIRKAAKMIEDKLNIFREKMPQFNKEESDRYLSMVALDIAVKYCKLVDSLDVNPFAEKIEELNKELEKYLSL